MATAQWGLFEWGLGEWGSREAEAETNLEASGSIVLTGTADLRDRPAISMEAAGSIALTGSAAMQLSAFMVASGSIALTAVAPLTTSIRMIAAGDIVMTGDAALRVGRFATNLQECGDPLSTACQEFFP